MEAYSLDEKLDEKVEEIKSAKTIVLIAQMDCIHQVSVGHKATVLEIATRLDKLDTQEVNYGGHNQPLEKRHRKIDFLMFSDLDTKGFILSVEEHFLFV